MDSQLSSPHLQLFRIDLDIFRHRVPAEIAETDVLHDEFRKDVVEEFEKVTVFGEVFVEGLVVGVQYRKRDDMFCNDNRLPSPFVASQNTFAR